MLSKKRIISNNNHVGSKDSSRAHGLLQEAVRPTVRPDSIQGCDDAGHFYANHAELEATQQANKDVWYATNDAYWRDGGCGGVTDDEAMVGDTGGIEDGEEGLDFLDRFLAEQQRQCSGLKTRLAIDAGAGVGRITKYVLLKRFDSVLLIEADPGWSKQSRKYLGRKRSEKCTFECKRLEKLSTTYVETQADLVWIQWTLQYLTDQDAVQILKNLAARLVQNTGVLVVKENRPYGGARHDRFQMDTPEYSGRYDITRTDNHHRLLFQRAGLWVDRAEEGVETNTYALRRGRSRG